MFDIQDPEDRQIRVILLSAATAVVAGFLSSAVILAVMISMNFNFLNWME
ncbi:MAG: hypothetical protein IAE94_13380 [Chthoniobacterales bacterium]|nr:hypothetical protein [Chthoniobacterales bacterium]